VDDEAKATRKQKKSGQYNTEPTTDTKASWPYIDNYCSHSSNKIMSN